MPLDGKPEAVTDAKDGVVAFDYAPKADAVFYTIDATTTDKDDFSGLREKFDKIEYGHGKRTVSEAVPRRSPDEDKPREGSGRQPLHPRVRGHAGRQADRDGQRDRRHGDEVRGRDARGRVGRTGRSSRRRRTCTARRPRARTRGSKGSRGTRTAPASRSAASTTRTRRRSSSAN